MKECGILMTPENYRKSEDGSKTMTRRIVKAPDELKEFLEPFVQQVVLAARCPFGTVGETVPIINADDRSQRFQAELLEVRVERLQEMSDEDKIAEGMDIDTCLRGRHDQWVELWQSIHGPGSWELNPWVWVIAYRRIQP